MVGPSETQILLHEFALGGPNPIIRENPRLNILELFFDRVWQSPDQIATEIFTQKQTYRELARRVWGLAKRLQKAQVKRGNKIGVVVSDHPDTIMCFLAIWCVGAIYIPIDTKLPVARQKYIADTAECTCIVNASGNDTAWPEAIPISDLILDFELVPNFCLKYPIEPKDLAYIVFTSGSTGLPKGVMVQHQSLINLLTNSSFEIFKRPGTRTMNGLSSGFDGFFLSSLMPLCYGSTVVFCGDNLPGTLKTVHQTILLPSIIAALDPRDFTNLDHLVVGGEALPRKVADNWLEYVDIINAFGPTETTVVCLSCPVPRSGPIPVGRPMAGYECYILDPSMQLVPIGAIGEIVIGGIGVSQGYINRPDLNTFKFVVNPFTGDGMLYHTGDLGRWLPDGQVECLGRIDSQVKLRGFRIELDEVRSVLLSQPGVQDCTVFVHGSFLVGYVFPETHADEDHLRSVMANHLPSYMVPTYILGLPTVPLTTNHKCDVQFLRNHFTNFLVDQHQPESSDSPSAPASKTLHALAMAMSDVLSLPLEQINPGLSFVKLGGDSISAIRLTSLCRERGIQLSVDQIFKSASITALADLGAERPGPIQSPENAAPINYQPFSLLGTADWLANNIDSVIQEAASELHVGREYIVDILPVSSLQLGFLINTLKDPSAYMVQESLVLSGPLDTDRLRQVWHQLAQRHSILRTKFMQLPSISDHTFVQVVGRQCDIEWTVVTEGVDSDLKQLEKSYFAADRQRGFTFDGPLLRMALYRTSADSDQHLCFFTFHHALLDAWSQNIALAELVDIYHGADLAPCTQFTDYIAHLQSSDQTKLQQFWKDNLEAAKPTLAVKFPVFSTDAPSTEYDTYGTPLSTDLPTLQLFCRNQQITLNSLLRSVWALTLSWYLSESQEVTFGGLTSGRNVPVAGIEGMVGMAINTLPVRVHLDMNLSVSQYIRQINELSFKMTDYEQCGLIDINRWAHVDPEVQLFDSLMVYFSYPGSQTSIKNPDIGFELRASQNFVEYAYTTTFSDHHGQLICNLQYKSSHCNQAYARSMVQFMDHCIALMVDQPTSTLQDLMSIPSDEACLVQEWSVGPRYQFPQGNWLAYQLFTQHLPTRPDSIALETSDQKFTYAEVYHHSACMALALQKQGFQPGDFAALLFTRSAEFIFSYLGVQLAGGVCIPMDATNALDRLRYTIGVLENAWLVTTAVYQQTAFDELGVIQSRVLVANDVPFDSMPTSDFQPDTSRQSSDLMYILFTSGTTGRPKGVPIRHESLLNYILAYDQVMQLDTSARMLQAMNISFDVCVNEIFGVFHAGGTLVLQDGNIIDTLKRVTTCCLIPSILAALDPQDFPNLSQVAVSGEPLPSNVAQRWCTHVRLYNNYGPTEASISSHSYSVQPAEPVTIGRALANYEGYILDDQLRPVPIGVPGELCLGGIGISDGYWKQPHLTAQAFLPNPFGAGNLYRTGDLACWLPNGTVHYLCRKDFQVKLRGYRIELGEIENTSRYVEGVTGAVACVIETRLVLYVSPNNIDTAELWAHLTTKLPTYMVPNFIVGLDLIPLTTVGKADRKALQARPLPLDDPLEMGPTILTATFIAVQELLAGIFEISPSCITPSASFLRLGGDSIMAIRFSSMCRSRGWLLSISQILQARNVLELAGILESQSLADCNGLEKTYLNFSLIGLEAEPQLRDTLTQEIAKQIGVDKNDIVDVLPVSSLQLGFLINTLKDPSAYMVQQSFVVDGLLDVNRFYQAWVEVAQKHATLRTKFFQTDTMPGHAFLQVVTRDCDIEWSTRTLGTVEDMSKLETAYFAKDRQRGFDFRGPLLRFTLYTMDSDHHLCFFTFHHAVLDAWSQNIIFGEILELYHHGSSPPGTPFSAYIAHLQTLNQSNLESFWSANLAGAIPTPAIQFPIHQPQAPPSEFGSYQSAISVSQLALRTFCREQKVTLNALLRSTWALTLAHYLNETQEVTFGGLTSGRNVPIPGIEGMVGMSINTLPIRVQLDYTQTVSGFIQGVNQLFIDMAAYEHCSLLDIRKWTQANPEARPFNSLVVYDNFPAATVPTSKAEITIQPRDGQNYTEYAYTLSFADTSDGLNYLLVYKSTYCDKTYAKFLCQFLDHCLSTMVSQPGGLVGDLMSLPSEEARLVRQWSEGPRCEFPQCHWLAHQLFTQHIATHPDAIALETSIHKFTYAEVYCRARSIASALQSQGFQPGNLAALLFTRSAEFIFSYLGVLLAGGVCVPMDLSNSLDRLEYTISQLDDAWLLTTTGHLVMILERISIDNTRFCLVDTVDHQAPGNPSFQPDHTRTSSDLAYIVFTSGTTGRPKGVPVRHESLVNYTMANCKLMELDSDCRFLQLMNISFDGCLIEIFGAFHSGGTLVLQDGDMIDRLGKVNTCVLIPSVLATLDPVDFPNLTKVVAAGEALPSSVAYNWCPRVHLFNVCGPTEITIVSHADRIQLGYPVTIGRPLPNVQGYILDNKLRPVPIGVPGELCIGGIGVTEGYWKQPELTAKAFIPNPFGPGKLYRSGDLVCWLPDGRVQFISRKDFQIKLRGYRIELGEIENTVSSVGGVSNAVACVTQKQLVLYVAPAGVDISILHHQLAQKLPPYMVPNFIVTLDHIPLTAVGKADRKALQALPLPAVDPDTASDIENHSWVFLLMREALASALNIKPQRVIPTDSFLQLGGDSISAIQFSNRCKRLGLHLSVADILKYPRLSVMEQHAHLMVLDDALPVEYLDPVGPVPFTAVQRYALEEYQFINQFNQSTLIQCCQELSQETVRAALMALFTHHDMMRVQLTRIKDHWHQQVLPAPVDSPGWLDRFVVMETATIVQDQYPTWVSQMQQKISIECGPILGCGLLILNGQQHLYLTIHHFTVDFISWRIILEDLEALLTNQPLPGKTTPFREWATKIHAYSQTLSDSVWPDVSPFDPAQGIPLDYRLPPPNEFGEHPP
ncbi:hypothetical protein H4R33_004281, partial [Dimargaris cristalligena]